MKEKRYKPSLHIRKFLTALLFALISASAAFPSSHTDGKEFQVARAYPTDGRLCYIKIEAGPGYLEERSDSWCVWVWEYGPVEKWEKAFRDKGIEPLEVYRTLQVWYYCYVVLAKRDVYLISIER